MNLIQDIKQAFNSHLQQLFNLNKPDVNLCSLDLNIDPAKEQFGDINANAAMILAKTLKKNPRDIARQIIDSFKHSAIAKIELAGPGFLNIYLKPESFSELMQQLLEQNEQFFKLSDSTPKKRFNVEFVSTNPTGPLHMGHGRGGVIGDVLANVLNFIGHHATKEFYINDAGAQIKKLGKSFQARCEQVAGNNVAVPEDGYQGEYLLTLAQEAIKKEGLPFLKNSEDFFSEYAKDEMLRQLHATLAHYGITFDVWFSEKSLHTSGAIEAALEILNKNDYLYEKDGALWFKSQQFGDDKDRVIKKATSDLTYVASDIAYMENKAERGFDHMVMILGHDHHSYGVRLEGLRQALNIKASLEVILVQMVKMKASGELVRMSKRAGNIVTLDDVIDTVGVDVARFFYLHRKADAQLEFDIDLALKKTDENPVYYIQYALVRLKSILAKAAQEKSFGNLNKLDALHIGTEEQFLLKKIVSLKELLENISENYHTHLLTYYVIELANAFHSYYSKNKVIDTFYVERSRARLLLITELKNLFELCLKLLGISRPEKM